MAAISEREESALLMLISLAKGLIGQMSLLLFRWLLFNESRRTDCYADLLAANVAGTEAVVEVLLCRLFSEDYKSAVPYWKSVGVAPEHQLPLFRERIT